MVTRRKADAGQTAAGQAQEIWGRHDYPNERMAEGHELCIKTIDVMYSLSH